MPEKRHHPSRNLEVLYADVAVHKLQLMDVKPYRGDYTLRFVCTVEYNVLNVKFTISAISSRVLIIAYCNTCGQEKQ